MPATKMNQEIKQEWLRRLRSDHYTQNLGELRGPRSNSRCCLGVLCDIYAERENAEWDHGQFFVLDDDGDIIEGENDVLPDEVVQWAGLHFHQGAYVPVDGKEEASLSMLNDGLQHADPYTFEEIADKIEKHL